MASPLPEYTLVLTATVTPSPGGARQIRRTDPAQRLEDYERALRRWLALPDPRVARVIFLENSGYPLVRLEEFAARWNVRRRPCEFISLPAADLPPQLHYGYGEFRLLDEGLARSALYVETIRFIKSTGRYFYPGISRLLNRLPREFEFAADAHNNRFVPGWPRYLVPVGLFASTRVFFDANIRHLYRGMHAPPPYRRQFMEDVLFDTLMPRRGEPGLCLRWPINCEPVGIGANGRNFRAPRRLAILAFRALVRRVAPRWWF